MLDKQRILITGGAGYIGSRLAAYLLSRGAHVTVYDAMVYGGPGLLPFVGEPNFVFIRGDVRDEIALAGAMRDVDAVIHLAAIVGEPACSVDTTAAVSTNQDAAIAAMTIADRTQVERFVFVSTCSNYGAASVGELVSEDAPLDPLSLYAETKVAAERAALSSERTSTTTVLRLGTICGLSARMRFDLLVNDMARAAALNHEIEVYKPQAWRPYLHVADVGRIMEKLLRAPTEKLRGRVYNVVAENYQKSGLVSLVRKHFPAAKIRIVEAEADNRDYQVSAERVRKELGFQTMHTVEDAFLEVARAVSAGVFVDPLWPGFSALPLKVASHG